MYVHAEFVTTGSIFPLFITVELQIKCKMFAKSPWCCAVCKKLHCVFFLKRSITILCSESYIIGINVGTTSQVHAFSVWLLILGKFQQYRVGVVSSGITFIPNFMKIRKSVRTWKGRYAQISWWYIAVVSTSLKTGMQARNVTTLIVWNVVLW
jgi:hypothetical protein